MQAGDTGAAPEDRSAKLDSARQWNVGLSVLAIAAAAGFSLGGATLRLPSMVVLTLLPAALVYLVQQEPSIYAIAKPKQDNQRTDLSLAFIACGLGLFLGDRDIHFVETQMLLEYAGLIALLGCALIFAAAKQNPQFWSTMFSTAIIAGMYGWGLAGSVDYVRDKSAPANYTTLVTDKYESYHRGTSYHLVFAPWGPMQAPTSLTVSSDTYSQMEIGGQACLELHPGVLHVQWYRMVACNDNGQR